MLQKLAQVSKGFFRRPPALVLTNKHKPGTKVRLGHFSTTDGRLWKRKLHGLEDFSAAIGCVPTLKIRATVDILTQIEQKFRQRLRSHFFLGKCKTPSFRHAHGAQSGCSEGMDPFTPLRSSDSSPD